MRDARQCRMKRKTIEHERLRAQNLRGSADKSPK